MSYSLSVKAPTKAAALAAASSKFDELLALQPEHSTDRAAALGNLSTLLDLLPADNDTHDVSVSMNGSIGYVRADDGTVASLTSAGAAASVFLVTRSPT